MLVKKPIHPTWYALTDHATAVLGWCGFSFVRRQLLAEPFTVGSAFWLGVVFIPAAWLILYALVGSYHSLYKKSRLTEAAKTFVCSFIGCIVLFFLILLNDQTQNYNYYTRALGALLGIHFFTTYAGRLLVLTLVKKQLRAKTVHFKALIAGNHQNALAVYKKAETKLAKEGYWVTGYVAVHDQPQHSPNHLPKLGELHELENIIDRYQIELVVIAIDKTEQPLIESIINRLSEKDVAIKIQANTLDILAGSVRTNNVLGAVLIDLHTGLMPQWQLHIKRVVDVVFSFICLVLLAPLFLYIVLRVRLSSKGPIFFVQERIGYKSKPFQMYKFRSSLLYNISEPTRTLYISYAGIC